MFSMHVCGQVQPNSTPLVYNTLLELYLQEFAHQTDGAVSIP